MGEGAGASELVAKTVQALAHEWTRRGPATQLTPAFLAYTGCNSLAELLEALIDGRKRLDASAAPLVFKVAQTGDPVAINLIRWAGSELGELAKCVIRQLEFEDLEFEVVLTGSLFDGGPLLTGPLRETILNYAPGARLVRRCRRRRRGVWPWKPARSPHGEQWKWHITDQIASMVDYAQDFPVNALKTSVTVRGSYLRILRSANRRTTATQRHPGERWEAGPRLQPGFVAEGGSWEIIIGNCLANN
jgi:hypothetical protein